MEKVRVRKVYNLVNPNGDKLLLRLGLLQSARENGVVIPIDNGWRWSFEGKKIPMPVRSRTWFNGFPEGDMLRWLNENGWVLQACVDMASGVANVYNLPDAPKANESKTVYIVFDEDVEDPISIFDNRDKAKNHYNMLAIAGSSDVHLYEAKEIFHE